MVSNSYQFTNKEKKDLDKTLNYIINELCAPFAAKKLFIEINNTINKICDFPKSFPTVDNDLINEKEIRRAVINQYLMYYTYKEDKKLVIILRIVHVKRFNYKVADFI